MTASDCKSEWGPATNALARIVFDHFNHADPGNYPGGWDALGDADRDVYREAIEVLACNLPLLSQSLSELRWGVRDDRQRR
jgi:hypothetical protein